jgi:iron complex outermembrane receptor protein
MRARPIDGLDLFASATYIDAFYSSFQNSACPFEQSNQPTCDFTGKPLSLTPKWAFAIGGEYSHNLGAFLPSIAKPVIGYLGADFSYQTKFFSTPDDSIYSIINAYGLLDLHAGLKLEDESVDLSVWAHNVFDKHYFTQLTPVTAISAGAIGGQVGDPFMAGFTLRVRI